MANTLADTQFKDMTPKGPDFCRKKYIYTLVETSFNEDTRDMELVFVKRNAKNASNAILVKSQIVLTGIILEHLRSNKNKLFAFYAKYIVAATHCPQIYPSWYIKIIAKTQKEIFLVRAADEESVQRQKLLSEKAEIDRKIKDIKQNKKRKVVSSKNAELKKKKNEISQTEMKISELSDEIQTISNDDGDERKNLVSSLYEQISTLTESVYRLKGECYAISNGRSNDKALLHQLKKREKEIPQELSDVNQGFYEKQLKINNWYMSEISRANKKKVTAKRDVYVPQSPSTKRESSYNSTNSRSDIHSINRTNEPTDIQTRFYPLRNVMLVNKNNKSREIMGCYVIRNTHNGRCYVGQSKHVMKRLKEHFDGTKPRNYIFSDDYYSSTDREHLFEVAFYRCNSASELDALERHLIRLYKAYQTGYNSTSGNK